MKLKTVKFSRNINNNIQHYAQAAPAHVQGQWSQNGASNGQNNGHSHHPPHIPHIQHQMQPRFQHQPYGQFNTQPMMPQSDPVAILRDSSLDCFKTKLPTTKNPDGATEIRVDNDKVIISWSLCSNIELETKDRRNHWPRWLANCRD